jgi:hypothetical protein
MTWQITAEFDDQQLADFLYEVMLRKLSDKLGFPEIKVVDGTVVCEYKGVDFTKVERIVINGVELERTPGEVAVSQGIRSRRRGSSKKAALAPCQTNS